MRGMMIPFFIILHPLVDACSVTVLVVGGMSWQRVLAYNTLAFALEFPLGVALAAVGAVSVGRGLRPRRNHQKTNVSLCRDCGGPGVSVLPMRYSLLILSALFDLVTWRSWTGLLAGGMNAASYGSGVLMEI